MKKRVVRCPTWPSKFPRQVLKGLVIVLFWYSKSMQTVDKLLFKYPNLDIIEVEQELDQAAFDAQKSKHEVRNAEGGAIGTVWLDDNVFVLTRRTGLHAGWALIGGTVEEGEMFEDAFLRELLEETGIKAKIERVVLLERKTFISPSDERFIMDVALIEATALKGQEVVETEGAKREGLTVKAFSKNSIPDKMIFKDREKLKLLVESHSI